MQDVQALNAETIPTVKESPNSPFLARFGNPLQDDIVANEVPGTAASASSLLAVDSPASPFLSRFAIGDANGSSPEDELYIEMVSELRDADFNEAVQQLTYDIRKDYLDRIDNELPGSNRAAEKFVTAKVDELLRSIEDHFLLIENQAGRVDRATVSEQDIEDFFQGIENEAQNNDMPPFEDFFKKLFKKVKKAVKKGVKIAKKVGKTLGKLSPMRFILNRLKKIVKPLLKRVLQFALNKIPARYRPLARRLAKKLKGKLLREVPETGAVQSLMSLESEAVHLEAIAMDPRTALAPAVLPAADFDNMIAGYLRFGMDFDLQQEAVEYFDVEDDGRGDDLARARQQFAEQFAALEEGKDPEVVVEGYVTAILTALRLGIKIVGRKRVVNFISKIVARLIRRFVGKRNSKPLSRAIVDAGLKLVSLEAPENTELEAGFAIAGAIEKMTEALVTEVDQETVDDEAVLESIVQSEFGKAVAESFPPQMIRSDLRPNASTSGFWVMMPANNRKKRYKRFSKPVHVTIYPGMAKAVRTFGGHSLASVLRDQLGVALDGEAVEAQVHIFEALRDTSIADIALHETTLPGLQGVARQNTEQFHPLTPENAAMLMPADAELGVDVPSHYLDDRQSLAVGQRLFFLAIPRARVLTRIGLGGVEDRTAARVSEVNVRIDFPRERLGIYNFLSETAAHDVAGALRTEQPVAAVVNLLRGSLASALKSILSGKNNTHLHIVRRSPSRESFSFDLGSTLRVAGEQLTDPLLQFLVNRLVKQLSTEYAKFSAEFTAAADASADGATMIIELANASDLIGVFEGSTMERIAALSNIARNGISGTVRIRTVAGFVRGTESG